MERIKVKVKKYRLLHIEEISKKRKEERKRNKWKYCFWAIKYRCENPKANAYKYYGVEELNA